MPKFYPIYIELENCPVLVVGGGNVALRKVQTLLEYGACVRIISPKLIPQLQKMIDNHLCEWVPKKYTPGDIQDAILVYSCTEKEEVNAQVANDAKANNRLVNAVDDPKNCTFIVPSIMNTGDLTIAVSTAGSSPIVARQIREELEGIYGKEMDAYLDLLKGWRPKIKKALPIEKRQQFWNRVTDGEVLRFVREGQLDQAKEVMEVCFQSLLD